MDQHQCYSGQLGTHMRGGRRGRVGRERGLLLKADLSTYGLKDMFGAIISCPLRRLDSWDSRSSVLIKFAACCAERGRACEVGKEQFRTGERVRERERSGGRGRAEDIEGKTEVRRELDRQSYVDDGMEWARGTNDV